MSDVMEYGNCPLCGKWTSGYRDTGGFVASKEHICAECKLLEAEAKLKVAIEALEWYADPETTRPQKDGFGGTLTDAEIDGGERALEALAKLKEDV